MSAIVFRGLGYEVHVLERSSPETLQSQAAGLRAGPDVHAFIERYVKNFPQYYNSIDTLEVLTAGGQVATQIPVSTAFKTTTWLALYTLFMAALLRAEEGRAKATYETRKQVTDVRKENGKMSVTFRNLDTGTSQNSIVDLVIAADGASSKVRKQFLPNVAPEYVGYVTWRGRVAESEVSQRTREALREKSTITPLKRNGYFLRYMKNLLIS
jgi:2-polyprenyl-6-methoxyphenol hydroxylase-like FAD-dependent oxidoreductase